MPAEAGGLARDGPIGILACAGPLPLEVARAARRLGRGPYIVGIEGFASPEIEEFAHAWVNLGQIGRMIDSLRRAGCRDLVIAGAMRRPNLWKVKIDRGFFRGIGTVLRMTRGGDDSVLRRVVTFFEGQGFRVIGAQDVAPHLVAPPGTLGAVAPTAEMRAAIERGAQVIQALGPFDVGQAVVATPAAIVAIEGVGGTDAMLAGVAEAQGKGDGAHPPPRVLVKLPKPGQELRVDLPTIGPSTIERAVAARIAGIAVRDGHTLILEREETILQADAAGMFIIGVQPPAIRGSPALGAEARPLVPRSRRIPSASDRCDIAIGRELLAAASAHGVGRAAVVSGEHVLALSAGEPVASLLERLGSRADWGLRLLRNRSGVLMLDARQWSPGQAEIEEIVAAAGSARLAGIAVLGGNGGSWSDRSTVEIVDSAKLFLVTSGAAA
jgi:DUF1009 family protein